MEGWRRFLKESLENHGPIFKPANIFDEVYGTQIRGIYDFSDMYGTEIKKDRDLQNLIKAQFKKSRESEDKEAEEVIKEYYDKLIKKYPNLNLQNIPISTEEDITAYRYHVLFGALSGFNKSDIKHFIDGRRYLDIEEEIEKMNKIYEIPEYLNWVPSEETLKIIKKQLKQLKNSGINMKKLGEKYVQKMSEFTKEDEGAQLDFSNISSLSAENFEQGDPDLSWIEEFAKLHPGLADRNLGWDPNAKTKEPI